MHSSFVKGDSTILTLLILRWAFPLSDLICSLFGLVKLLRHLILLTSGTNLFGETGAFFMQECVETNFNSQNVLLSAVS